MPEEAFVQEQPGQAVTPEPQAGAVTDNGGTVQAGGQGASEAEQPLSLTRSQLQKFVSDALENVKQDWLNESYQNSQSMNDKFEKRVNAVISQFEKAGIKTDKVSAAKFLRAQDQQAETEKANAQRQSQNQLPAEYAQFLQRFGIQPNNARMAADQRLTGAYSLEREYGVQLMRDDPEYKEYFGDPKKQFSAYQFQRDYEKALLKKKERTSTSNDSQQGTVAGIPSMSGTGKKANTIGNRTSSQEIYDMALAEMRNRK